MADSYATINIFEKLNSQALLFTKIENKNFDG